MSSLALKMLGKLRRGLNYKNDNGVIGIIGVSISDLHYILVQEGGLEVLEEHFKHVEMMKNFGREVHKQVAQGSDQDFHRLGSFSKRSKRKYP